jgi:hypothetical protein
MHFERERFVLGSSGSLPFDCMTAEALAAARSIPFSDLLKKIESFSYGVGMNTVTISINLSFAQHTTVTEDSLTVDLADGRTISVPLAWYPRLYHGTASERANWRFIGDGVGIHWPDLDEDISIANVIAGHPSNESQPSLARWLHGREKSPGN